jgi:hypothetical protein
VQPRLDAMLWITEAALTGIREKFAAYLDFSEWK